jgi:hypothetical protein
LPSQHKTLLDRNLFNNAILSYAEVNELKLLTKTGKHLNRTVLLARALLMVDTNSANTEHYTDLAISKPLDLNEKNKRKIKKALRRARA